MASAPSTNVRAVTVGLVTLVLVYVGGAMLLNSMIVRPTDRPILWTVLAPIFAVVLWLLPGFVTGYVAKELPFRHGLWLGFGSIGIVLASLNIIESLLHFTNSIPLSMIIGFLIPIVGGSVLGAFIGRYFAKRRDAP